MRDLLITIIIFGSIPFILQRPHVGILMWFWISLMNPHRLGWGMANSLPVAMVIGAVTAAAWLMSKEEKKIQWDPIITLMAVYLAWTGMTTLLAIVPNAATGYFEKFAKSMVMIFLALILMRSEKRFHALIWIVVLSIGFYSTKGGIFTLMTGGQYRVWGPPGSVINGNNELAIATLMILPLMRYLAMSTEIWWVRWGLNGAALLSLASVIGSYSRGAFLAMAVLSIAWWWKSRHRLTFGIIAVVAAMAIMPMIPSKWYDRMQTIENYEQDGSARGRLQMWTFAINVAKDRPITGGGFGVFKGGDRIYEKYYPEATKRRNVHSVYFEVLGTQGFVGMMIFIALGIATLRTISWIQKRTRHIPELIKEYRYAIALKLSLIAFAVGGAFLNLSIFDLFYLLLGSASLCKGIVLKKLEEGEFANSTMNIPSFRRAPELDYGNAAPAQPGFRRT
jgi:probable O-glycosylation ligase (exosortase A-associated)